MKVIRWQRKLDIGFWINQNPVRFYYGIISDRMSEVKSQGIKGRWIPLYLEPYSLSNDDVILVIDMLPRFLMEHMDKRLTGNTSLQKDRLLSEEIYDKWTRYDRYYYDGCRILIDSLVPSRYITGYMEQRRF